MAAAHSSSLLKRAVALIVLAIPALAALGVVGPASPARAATDGKGYWEVASDGGIFSFGDAKFQGSTGGTSLNAPIVGMAAHPSGDGYWFVASDGGVFGFGEAGFFGSMGGQVLNRPIVGIAAHPSGNGYWLVADDGGIFSFGAARFQGSMGGVPLNAPIVGMAAHPSGNGYWFVAADGGIFSFGDAKFFGSMGGSPLNAPIVGMAAHPSGNGYWFVARDGGIFSFGAAGFFGSMGGERLNQPIVGMAAHPSGNGYWFVARDGGIFSFGESKFFGSMGGSPLNAPIVGMAATPDSTTPTATVNQAAGQEDPTDESDVDFTVTFSEPVGGFTGSDVTIGGTAGATTATVTGGPTTYNVAVSGMTGDGTVTLAIPAGAAVDSSGNGSAVATSTDNSVAYDNTDPGATVTKADGQGDPTSEGPIDFTVVFSEGVTGFSADDVAIDGTAGATTATVTGGPTTYNVAVSGMTGDGEVTITVPEGGAFDGAGNGNAASTVPADGDNTVTYDTGAPSATVSTADGQEDPTDEETIDFKVLFNEPVTGFATGDVVPGGTAPGTKIATITGGPTSYNVAVTGVTGEGTVTVEVDAAKANDLAGNANVASNEHTINVDRSAPTVTVAKAATQENPTDESVVDFTVTFNEPVVGFGDNGDVTAGGDAPGPRNVVITNSGDDKSFNVAVSGMTSDGTVTLAVPAAVAQNGAGLDNTSSGTAPASVTYDVTAPTPTVAVAGGQDDPTNDDAIDFTVLFDEPVTGFGDEATDVTVSGDPGGTATVGDGGDSDPKTYTVSVSGMTESGTVTVSVPDGAARDAAGNDNQPSGTASVVYDNEAPTFDTISATGESTLVTATFSQPVLCTTVQSTDFTATVGGSPVAVNAAACTSPTDATIELTLASAPVGGATVSVRYGGDGITDAAGNQAPQPTIRATTAVSSLGVTVIKAATQENPTDGKTNPGDTPTINFTVQFTAPVTGFANEDVEVGGTATFGTKAATVGASTDGGRTYNVAVTGMNDNQVATVTVRIPAGKASDSAGNSNNASNVASVDYDEVEPTVTVAVASSQENPTNESPVQFSITTSERTDLAQADLEATEGANPASVTLTETSPTTYTAAVTATSSDQVVTLRVPAGVAHDPAGNDNISASSASVTRDTNGPTVTITKADSQPDPTNEASIEFKVEFNEEVFDISAGDFEAVDGASQPLSVSLVKNSATVYTASVTGMTADGAVVLTLPAGTVNDKPGNANPAPADGSVAYETVRPAVTVTAAGADRTNVSPIVFDIQFDEAVFEFVAADVTVDAPGNESKTFTATDADTYTVQVSGMGEGSVTVSVAAGVAKDAAGNTNTAAAPDTVVYDTSGPVATVAAKAGQANPTNSSPILFTVAFNEAVNGFTDADLTSQPTGTTATITDPGDGKTSYTVSVAGLAANTAANVTLTLAATSVSDVAGNTNPDAATGSVAYDNVAPVFSSIAADASSTNVVATFSEAIKCSTVAADGSDFLVSVNEGAGGVTAAVCTGTSDITIDLTVDPAPAAHESVTVAVKADAVTDAAGNAAPAQQRSTTATPVTVTVARAPGQNAESNQDSFDFQATFSEAVTGLTASGLTVSAPGAEVVTVTPTSGFHATYTITVSDVTTDGTVSVLVNANAASDEDGASNEASPAPATAERDTVPPTFDSIEATVNDADIVLNFVGGGVDCNTVANGDFAVEVNTTTATISTHTCAQDTTASTFNLTLTSPVALGSVEVDLIGTVTDLAGNAVPAATKTTVTSAPST